MASFKQPFQVACGGAVIEVDAASASIGTQSAGGGYNAVTSTAGGVVVGASTDGVSTAPVVSNGGGLVVDGGGNVSVTGTTIGFHGTIVTPLPATVETVLTGTVTLPGGAGGIVSLGSVYPHKYGVVTFLMRGNPSAGASDIVAVFNVFQPENNTGSGFCNPESMYSTGGEFLRMSWPAGDYPMLFWNPTFTVPETSAQIVVTAVCTLF